MSYLNRRWVRMALLALFGISLTACHFHGCHGFRPFPGRFRPIRRCR